MLGRPTPFFVAFAALLAGCAEPPPADPAPPAAPEPAPAPPPPEPTPEAPEKPAPAAPSLPEPVPEPALPPAPTGPSEFETAIVDGAYLHPRLDVSPLTTIRWRNLDTTMHSVIGEPGGFIGSGPLAPGSEFVWTFERPGEYAYKCRFHGDMTGLIVVA